MKKKISFIINPISGGHQKKDVEKAIISYLDQSFEYEILYTKAAGHAIELSKKASRYADIVVAVGGDGSINEVAQGLINTSTNMGIVPKGSGNGLARFLKIPLDPIKAIQVIQKGHVQKIDSIRIGEHISLNVSGIGFDALIAHKFNQLKKRGLISYIQVITQNFFRYKAEYFKLNIDGKDINTEAFLISFANSSQFGNNAHIAPEAIIDDGFLDLVIMHPFPKIKTLSMAMRIFNKSIHHSSYTQSYKAKHIKLQANKDIIAHIDGDAVILKKETDISINPLSLNMIVP